MLRQVGTRGLSLDAAAAIRKAIYSATLQSSTNTLRQRSAVTPLQTKTASLCLQPSRLLSGSSQPRYAQHPPSHRHHKDLYSILGVSPKATQQQIKDQFYKLSMLYHPDLNRGSHTAHQRFSEITEAYSVLGQHSLRRKYDRGLLQDYPRKPHHHDTHPHTHTHPEAAMSGTSTAKKVYDFDEFYRAHYGEALRWQRERTASQKAAAAEQARLATLSEPMHRLMIISVVLSVFLVGWLGAKYREQQQREGKWI